MNIRAHSIRKTIFFLCLCALSPAFFPAQAAQYVLGGKNGWGDVSVRDRISEGTGRFGYKCLELATDGAARDADTDLLLDFEHGFAEETGNYTVTENSLFLSESPMMGKSAAVSRNTGGGIVLSGRETGLFGAEGPAGSFTIAFWLCPAAAENGEMILNWRSSRNAGGAVLYQFFKVMFSGNRVEWLFSNLFDGYTENSGYVALESRRSLVPGKWTHHLVSFNQESGLLEYRIDGALEDVLFVTDTGAEGGTVYPFVLGVPAALQLCSSYTGMIDDFNIRRRSFDGDEAAAAETAAALKKSVYSPSGGRFVSEPLLVRAGSILDSVTAEQYVPEQTAVRLYVRAGDNCYGWTADWPEWKPVDSGEKISGLAGRYFQVAADLFPDGAGMTTPAVTEIAVNYTEVPPPLAPFTVTAEAGDGCVTLSWSYSVDDMAGGYDIYYGTRPGEYLGRAAAEGASPIDAGNSASFRITGLKNGTIYYFAVAARSKADERICGPLSKEVFARPFLK